MAEKYGKKCVLLTCPGTMSLDFSLLSLFLNCFRVCVHVPGCRDGRGWGVWVACGGVGGESVVEVVWWGWGWRYREKEVLEKELEEGGAR